MSEIQSSIKNRNKKYLRIVHIVPLILLIPIIGMMLSDNANMAYYIIAIVLLLSANLGLEFIIRKVKTTKLRITYLVGLLFYLFLFWGELGVGIFGTPFAGS